MTKSNEFIINKIQRAVKNNHRLFFVIEASDHIPFIYDCLKNNVEGPQPSVLWLYKTNKETAISQKIKTDVTFVNYQETDRILGNTFKMLILQNFEALTPNVLAKSVETVQGGGIIILITSQIIEGEIEFEGDKRVYYRFNKRLYKTMKKNDSFVFFDKELNIQNKRGGTKTQMNVLEDDKNTMQTKIQFSEIENVQEEDAKKQKINVCDIKEKILNDMKESLYGLSATKEQKCIIKHLDEKLNERNCKTIVSITAGRGRGKSAALGLTTSLAIHKSFSLILIASPAIENISMLFDFIIKGLNAIGYKEKIDYEIIKKISHKKKCITKIIIHKNHKQIIEYKNIFEPLQKLPDLLIIDEAAAIPIPYLKQLLICNLVFLASTTNGYEGTGRSLTYKLFSELKTMSKSENPFIFDEVEMHEPIRYSLNDPIESWLNSSLLLTATPKKIGFYPSLNECSLFCVNKDVLFSCNSLTEAYLSNLVSLFVSSHYKNSPNDLLTMADNDAHRIFVLTTPNKLNDMADTDAQKSKLSGTQEVSMPLVLCAIQVAHEREVDKININRDGNLISWVMYDNYLLDDFLSLKGVRIVRIAVHPDLLRMGYGQYAVNLLVDFYNKVNEKVSTEQSLFVSLENVENKKIDFIGSSFGTTEPLINFWKKSGFVPVYTKQTPSLITGEYSSIVLKCKDIDKLHALYKMRLFYLFSSCFKNLRATLCLSLFYKGKAEKDASFVGNHSISHDFTDYDKKRLEKYCTGECDIRVITDLLSRLSASYFIGKIDCSLSILQQCILLSIGCQNKTEKEIMVELGIDKDKFYNVLHKTILAIYLSLSKKE